MKRGTILAPFAGLAFLSVVTISLTTACTNPSGPSLSGGSTITTFAFMNPTANGTIAGTNILITAPWSTDVEAAVAAFSVSPGATITVNGVLQVSGVTANNFSSPVKYLVTAQNGSMTKYLVQVTVQTIRWTNQTDGGNSTFGNQQWSSVATGEYGTHLAATGLLQPAAGSTVHYIWTSGSAGSAWSAQTDGSNGSYANQLWSSIASSADGSHLAAVSDGSASGSGSGGSVWTSTDGGATWTEQTDGNNSNFMGLRWKSIACSAAGNVLAAVSVSVANGETIIWTSTDDGVSWTQSLVVSSVEVSKAVAVMSADSTHIAVAGNIGAPGFGIWTVP